MGGGAAGLGGAAAAHVLTALCDRAGSETWLKGPYGPQFFNITLYTAVFYASIGGAAARRAAGALAGALPPLLGIGLAMAVLTRLVPLQFTLAVGTQSVPAWYFVVMALYSVGIWGAVAAVGAVAARTRPWRGALAATAATALAYGLLSAFVRLAPSYAKTPWNPTGLIPSPVNLLDGVLSGSLLCLALVLDENFRRKTA
jgi:hypothetical protein